MAGMFYNMYSKLYVKKNPYGDETKYQNINH